MSTNQNKNEEEVDLGSLFKIIGKGFSNLFNFIGNIFKGIFHFFILILLFFKRNIIPITIAAVLGGVCGFFIQANTSTTYSSQMLVEPNFDSARQLYNNIGFYNDLVKQKDTIQLAKTFNLDLSSAASLKKFSIEPIINENDIINSYNDFIVEVDTTTVKSYTFDEFKAAFKDLDYRIHRIEVISEKSDIFSKLNNPIISSVVNNKYFKRLKELTNENLDRTDSVYRQNLYQVDSLRRVYMKAVLFEAKKQTTGTNIDFGGEKKTSKEIELFETNRKINYDLKKIAEDKAEMYEIVNVISNFQPVGHEVKGFTKNYTFILAFLGVMLVITILLLVSLNKFLENYKK